MRIGPWTFTQQRQPGSVSVRRHPRFAAEQGFGSVIAHTAPYHVGDEMVTLEFGKAMKAGPAVFMTDSFTTTGAPQTITTGERLASRAPSVIVGEAIGAATLQLAVTAGAQTGYLTVELWDTAGMFVEPVRKIGTIGVIDAATIGGAYAWYHCWGDSAPIAGTFAPWLVLTAGSMTGGTIGWQGQLVGGGPNGYKYTAGAWNALAPRYFDFYVWRAAEFCALRGLASDYGGGEVYDIDLDDGQMYTGIVRAVDGNWVIYPSDITPAPAAALAPCTSGAAVDVSVTLQLLSEITG